MEDESRTAREASAARTLLRLMLEHSNDGICLVSGDGTVLATTPAIDRMMGREPGTLVGTNGIALIHDDDVLAALDRRPSACKRPRSTSDSEP